VTFELTASVEDAVHARRKQAPSTLRLQRLVRQIAVTPSLVLGVQRTNRAQQNINVTPPGDLLAGHKVLSKMLAGGVDDRTQPISAHTAKSGEFPGMGTLQGVGMSPTLQEASSATLMRTLVLLGTEVLTTKTEEKF
jgi:hypothetical protein